MGRAPLAREWRDNRTGMKLHTEYALHQEAEELYQDALTAIDDGDLRAKRKQIDLNLSPFGPCNYRFWKEVKPGEFLEWAQQLGYTVPEELRPLLGHPHPCLPDYHVVDPIPYLSRAAKGHPTIWLKFDGDRSKHPILQNVPDKPFEVSTPNWVKLLEEPLWPVWIAARLMFGLAPFGLTEPDGVPRRRGAPLNIEGPQWPPEAARLERLTRKAILAGDLEKIVEGISIQRGIEAYHLPPHIKRPEEKDEIRTEHWAVAPSKFVRWAKSQVRRFPPELRPLLDASQAGQGSEWEAPQEGTTGEKGCSHSPDFRSANWHGVVHEFTGKQAQVVEALWQTWAIGAPSIGEAYLLSVIDPDAESKNLKLKGLFDKGGHSAWGTMIVPGSRKGTVRLSEPPEKDTSPT